ncbi:MAG: heat-inducible transcriptional repressor HrcA [Pygmaiobacter massiliensis]|nr:heat-inducible transcriptional repressor HrcA [Pygmaiobacter massiliensis]
MDMDERKRRILAAIVALYAQDGEPVGSNLLCNYLNMAVSSATLRNEMATLTRLGLLEQPHTSAGRVPSTEGYRYYIENLIEGKGDLKQADRRRIDEAFSGFDFDPERLAKGAAKELSAMTGYPAVAMTPKSDDVKVAYFNVIQTGRFSAAVLSVSSVGGVATRVAAIERPLTAQDIETVTNYLNRTLAFVSKEDVSPLAQNLLREGLADQQALWPIVKAAVTLLQGAGRSKVFVAGQDKLLNWPELEPSLRGCLKLLGNTDQLRQIVAPPGMRTAVLMGDELSEELPGVAIAAKRYLAGGGRSGTIALLGPSRMPYLTVLPKLEYFAEKLGRAMTRAEK